MYVFIVKRLTAHTVKSKFADVFLKGKEVNYVEGFKGCDRLSTGLQSKLWLSPMCTLSDVIGDEVMYSVLFVKYL